MVGHKKQRSKILKLMHFWLIVLNCFYLFVTVCVVSFKFPLCFCRSFACSKQSGGACEPEYQKHGE